MPFATSERDGIRTLTLDTPGAPVNIFNRATALQLVELLADVTPANTRAVVLASAKPNSFVNGVGLLLAHASRTRDDVLRAAEVPWQAYRALHELPVPTVAVVQGSCFGCGVELALTCDYRIATDSGETQFYMTELNDYLFLPLFGATWNLPATVGLADAIDLLLWGERWDSGRAAERGLVDEVVACADAAPATHAIVARAAQGAQAIRRRGRVRWGDVEDAIVARARARIAALPSPYRPVYEDGLELLCAGARQETSYAEHQRRELERSAASALAPLGKAAFSFFYLRQVAAERAAGRMRGDDPPVRLGVDRAAGRNVESFAARLRARSFPGFQLTGTEEAEIVLTAADAPRARAGCTAAVRLDLARRPTAPIEIYAPNLAGGGRLVELATAPEPGAESPPEVARLARTLQRLGFEVARTRPRGDFVTTKLLAAFLAPLLRHGAAGGDAGSAALTLREAGFVRAPRDWVSAIDREALIEQLATALGRDVGAAALAGALAALDRADAETAAAAGASLEPALIDALCVSLLDAAHDARAAREVADPTIVDLVARELLDFPRHLGSLCTWLKRERVARAVADAARDRVRALAGERAFATALGFAAEGREFYR